MDSYLSFLSKINVVGIAIGFVVLIYFVYVFLIQYHLIRFGVGIRPKMTAVIFLFGSAILLIPVIIFYIKFDVHDFIQAVSGSVNNNLPGSYRSNLFQ